MNKSMRKLPQQKKTSGKRVRVIATCTPRQIKVVTTWIVPASKKREVLKRTVTFSTGRVTKRKQSRPSSLTAIPQSSLDRLLAPSAPLNTTQFLIQNFELENQPTQISDVEMPACADDLGLNFSINPFGSMFSSTLMTQGDMIACRT